MISLHQLPRPQIQDFLDYIDLVRPGLKGQASKLSTVLSRIVDNRLSPQRLVLDKLTSNLSAELGNRSLVELFQLVPTDSYQARAIVGPSSDQMYANNQLSCAQGTMNSVQKSTYQELDREFKVDIKDLFCFQDIGSSAPQQSGYRGGISHLPRKSSPGR